MTDRTEEEQIEAIKAWWKENGPAVVIGIVLGIGALVGWRGWSSYQASQAVAASELYQQMLTARQSGDNEVLQSSGEQLLDEYSGTAYASLAGLMLGQQAVQEDDLAKAEEFLRLALDRAPEPSIEHVARLRLLQVMIAREQYDAALQMIESTAPGQYTAQYQELRGDILLAQDNPTAAREAYQVAMANKPPQAAGRDLLEMKLESLGQSDSPAANDKPADSGASE